MIPAASHPNVENVAAGRRQSHKRLLLLLTVPILLMVGLYVFRINVAVAIGNFLVVRDRIEPADLIFLLNGDPTVRPQLAATLWRDGMAPQVLIARHFDVRNQ